MTIHKFKSLRQKLMQRIIQILCVAFVVILSSVIWFNYSSAQKSLKVSEDNIRASIVAKGRILVANNSRALTGMVEDNAFTAVHELVSSTVSEDEEIVYGIFMDENRQAWVAQYSELTTLSHKTGDAFHDDISVWADQLEAASFRFVDQQGIQVYEFASPVISDDFKVGTIRYGITTKNMRESLRLVQVQSRQTIIYTLGSLILIASLVFIASFWIIRRFAIAITTPLGSLTHAAEVIAQGDYATKIDIESNDEIGLLADNFDSMRNTISKKITDLFEINAASDTFAVQYSKDALIKKSFQAFSRHFDVISGVMYVKNSQNQTTIESVHKNEESTQLVYISDEMLDSKKGPAKVCMSSTEIMVSNNLKGDRRFNSFEYSDKQNFAMIYIPILDKDQIVGSILFFCDSEGFSFEEGDYAYVKAVARSLAINIKNISMRDVITEQNLNLERKVEQRTESLKEKTSDIVNMMKNLNQGLFTILPDGKVHSEYSAHLEVLLETENITGELFSALLFSNCNVDYDQVHQIESAVNAVIGDEEMTFILNQHIFVNEYIKVRKSGESCYMELDWNPIIIDDVVEKIMVTVRDVSDVKILQAQAEEKEKELIAIGHLLNVGSAPFFQFVITVNEVLDFLNIIIEPEELPVGETFSDLLRNLHTLKGNARTLSFKTISNDAHQIESLLDNIEDLDSGHDPKWLTLKIKIRDILRRLKSDLDYYSSVAHGKLGWTNSQMNLDRRSVLMNTYNKLIDVSSEAFEELKSSTLSDESKELLTQVARVSQALCSPSLSEIIAPLTKSLSSIASELSKPSPYLDLDVDNIHIKKFYSETLSSVFLHILRNSLDHGIEHQSERIRSNKSKNGTISIEAKLSKQNLVISIGDDGRGMALDHIKQSHVQAGDSQADAEEVSDEDLANLIFRAGLSTSESVTQISGRGIGMDAVKHMLTEIGADIGIRFTSEKNNGFRPFSIDITLPKSVYEEKIMLDSY